MLAAFNRSKSSTDPVSYSHVGHDDLNAVTMDPDWVLEGAPVPRVKRIHASSDNRYDVVLWECNAGTFRWHFSCDEVVHILDGEVTVREDDGTERTLRAGDTALFPKGVSNVWVVPTFVRKLASMRFHKPTPAELVRDAVRRGRKELKKLIGQVRPRAS